MRKRLFTEMTFTKMLFLVYSMYQLKKVRSSNVL